MLKIDCIHLIRKDSFLSNTNIDSKTERKDFSKNQRVHIKSCLLYTSDAADD